MQDTHFKPPLCVCITVRAARRGQHKPLAVRSKLKRKQAHIRGESRRQYSFRFECNLFLAAEESDGCERLGQTNSHAYKARAAGNTCRIVKALNKVNVAVGRHKPYSRRLTRSPSYSSSNAPV